VLGEPGIEMRGSGADRGRRGKREGYQGLWQCGQLDLPLDLNHLYRQPPWKRLRQVRQLHGEGGQARTQTGTCMEPSGAAGAGGRSFAGGPIHPLRRQECPTASKAVHARDSAKGSPEAGQLATGGLDDAVADEALLLACRGNMKHKNPSSSSQGGQRTCNSQPLRYAGSMQGQRA
jgi:hypothetical protein